MKRYGHLFEKIVTMENLLLAADKAKKGKSHRKDVLRFEEHRDELLLKLLLNLMSGKYVTSLYETFIIYEPKERKIYKLPFYPDRIVHHAIMNILESIWVPILIKLTYSCIKGRGIHKALYDVKKALKDKLNTLYCLKLDIRQFYPSIDHDILKLIIRRKLKDKILLKLLDDIIDSTNGVPIGNYLSQFFANLYLAYVDHQLKEVLKAKYYFRYADDIVILSSNKAELRKWLRWLKNMVYGDLKLLIKPNNLIFKVDTRGIDFVGYRMYHTHTLLRKKIKKQYCKRINKLNKKEYNIKYCKLKLASYLGWLKYCNSANLMNKTMSNKELLLHLNKTKHSRTN